MRWNLFSSSRSPVYMQTLQKARSSQFIENLGEADIKEAMFYEKLGENSVHCYLCNHNCRINEGKRGICSVRENIKGTLYSLVYGKLIAASVDPIEKKPLFHFLPGSHAYSIATVGCNFRCLNCQNFDIS